VSFIIVVHDVKYIGL